MGVNGLPVWLRIDCVVLHGHMHVEQFAQVKLVIYRMSNAYYRAETSHVCWLLLVFLPLQTAGCSHHVQYF